MNTIRLLLAATVVLAHSWDLPHGSHGPLPYAGTFAVEGFFVLSGFLVGRSRASTGIADFFWRRTLRIMPGYWAVLILTALAIAPAAALLTGMPFDWESARTYISSNAFLTTNQLDISDLTQAAPFQVWNASLWTLRWEFFAYIVAGVLLTVTSLRRQVSWLLFGLAITWLVAQLQLGLAPGFDARISGLGAFFAAGMVLNSELARIPVSAGLAALCTITITTTFFIQDHTAYALLAPLALGYLLLWLGVSWKVRVGSKNDISYGVYLYGAPLQQLMILTGVAAALHPTLFALLSLAAVLPIAFVSWSLIERPSLRLRSRQQAIRTLRLTTRFISCERGSGVTNAHFEQDHL